ncbi:Na+/H+ antiporter subunit E [Thalassolituus oleivorans]|uniref:Na+/H+ antiporter subunit E n=1 Tax=Thalassolituus oleivorans TaxID=187493 RepID=UPI00042DD62D|nr:Na+/H+ antiporter subunit E [Thalassolituus oleivorans]AHK16791.1 cation:proton antiporter [Thalassolituus oleivorans R6-15]
MKRLFPMPWHSLLLLIVWLLLNGGSVGHLILGSILAVLIPLLTHRYVSGHPPIRHPWKAVRYIRRLLWDIIVANIEVAQRVLAPNSTLKPGWVAYPLQVTDPFQMTLLASTISLTPGTVSVEFSEDRRWLYVHALHLDNTEELVDFIRRRYEQPLQEIFAC